MHHGEIATILLISFDSLIVAQKIAASIQDETILVYLDSLGMMCRVAMND